MINHQFYNHEINHDPSLRGDSITTNGLVMVDDGSFAVSDTILPWQTCHPQLACLKPGAHKNRWSSTSVAILRNADRGENLRGKLNENAFLNETLLLRSVKLIIVVIVDNSG